MQEIKFVYQQLLNSTELTAQSRGFKLEDLMRSILQFEELEPKASYRKIGEQMDGSFFWMGQTFIFEAKWEKNKISASSIYAFRGKVQGKFHTTSGIFIAMNGYHKDTEQALLSGKVGDILLFDGEDMHAIFTGEVSFKSVLKYKLRAAGDSGTLYAKYAQLIEVNVTAVSHAFLASPRLNTVSHQSYLNDLLVFVESRNDFEIVDKILKSVTNSFALSYRLISLEGAYNISAIPSFISTYQGQKKLKGFISFLDDDVNIFSFHTQINIVSEQLSKAAIPLNHLFLFIPKETKSTYQSTKSIGEAESLNEIKNKLISFLANTAEEYYDPEEFILSDILPHLLEDIDWDESEQCVFITDDHTGMPSRIESLDELVSHLNDKLIQNQTENLPLDWLNEMESEDYAWDIHSYIEENYNNKLQALGWE
ncbi:restriction endonuclease [Pedobacter terrae]|nr:restriction endonuclease [Pedobacter terrae]